MNSVAALWIGERSTALNKKPVRSESSGRTGRRVREKIDAVPGNS
jgi:hypothetical protein